MKIHEFFYFLGSVELNNGVFNRIIDFLTAQQYFIL